MIPGQIEVGPISGPISGRALFAPDALESPICTGFTAKMTPPAPKWVKMAFDSRILGPNAYFGHFRFGG
jgi:hypothetical protein